MFTGLVQALGTVIALESRGGDARLVLDAGAWPLDDVALGDSIAVSGACLTVVAREPARLAFDLSNETLACTTLGARVPGDRVNLEKALRFADRLGGHLVSGHVDAVAAVLAIEPDARAQRWRFALPPSLARYVAAKGSICVDGVSLTVNAVGAGHFEVALIPHTIEVTSFRDRRAGDRVNLEVDLVARYLERLHRAD
jgi:riboflavin synthase